MSARVVLHTAAAWRRAPQPDEVVFTANDVATVLTELADSLEPGDLVSQQFEARVPLVPNHLAEAIGRTLKTGGRPVADSVACVRVAALLGDCANRLDVKGDFHTADLLRVYAYAVGQAGAAL